MYILQVYFQQVRPLSECDAEDGRIVGYMLLDLVQGNRKDLAHAVRTFVNRAAMLRECGFCHIDAMLTCLLCATAQCGPADAPASIDPSSMTELQAAAIGRAIASSVHGSHAPIEALKKVVESHAVLGIMRSRFAWFFPMLQVLTARSKKTKSSDAFMKRLSSIVSAEAPNADVAPIDATSIADGADEKSGFTVVVELVAPNAACL